ncbi:MAG: hypothetical protein ACRED9_13045 [Caulobacteraceae bacterium]
MAPIGDYLMSDANSEISLARSAAPAPISDHAQVMVLRRAGYATAVEGSNGFLCLVERAWGAQTGDPEFWNARIRSPICFNPVAAKSFAPIYLFKTRLVMAGKSRVQIAAALPPAFDEKALPPLEPRAMCYMMSKAQNLNDEDRSWAPHLMFFSPGDAAKSWGANLPGSPVIAADDPEERATIFMVPVRTWSDGSPRAFP